MPCSAGPSPLHSQYRPQRGQSVRAILPILRAGGPGGHPYPREAAAMDSGYGARSTPRSVTMAETSAAGVTSKAG